MKRTAWLFVVLAGLLAATPGARAKEPAAPKIGVVDMERILRQSKAGERARHQLDQEKEDKKKILDQKKKEVDRLREEIEKKGTQLSAAARKDKEDQVQEKGRDLMRMAQDYESDLQRRDNELTQRILQDCQEIIQKIARENDFSLILEKRAVLFGSDGLDVTEKVLTALDKQQE